MIKSNRKAVKNNYQDFGVWFEDNEYGGIFLFHG